MAHLRSQLRLAQDLQRATQSIVEKLSVALTTTQEMLGQQVIAMTSIDKEYTEVEQE